MTMAIWTNDFPYKYIWKSHDKFDHLKGYDQW